MNDAVQSMAGRHRRLSQDKVRLIFTLFLYIVVVELRQQQKMI